MSKLIDLAEERLALWNQARQSLATAVHNDCFESVDTVFNRLICVERFWAFPGSQMIADLSLLLKKGEADHVQKKLIELINRIQNEEFLDPSLKAQHYFEVLVVGASDEKKEKLTYDHHENCFCSDSFFYRYCFVSSLEEAYISLTFNPQIQAVVVADTLSSIDQISLPEIKQLALKVRALCQTVDEESLSECLARLIDTVRPELDIYFFSNENSIAGEQMLPFSNSKIRKKINENIAISELQSVIFSGIEARFHTPFFKALIDYGKKPTDSFHALPISRGNSINKSKWIQELSQVLGNELLLGESSSTKGGLDSLLQPQGSIKQAQESLSRAFGSKKSFFVTNGTTTSNKIVIQALVDPGDIVLISHDCHKSHYYGLMLAGALPVVLSPYHVDSFGFFGGVSIKTIKKTLMDLADKGQLHRVKTMLLTNCTFDGVISNPQRIMEEVLAIKPDMIFVWDEAWFAYANFSPYYRSRSAMFSAKNLIRKFKSKTYRNEYLSWQQAFTSSQGNSDKWINERLLPDPDLSDVRVYATQSIHKTLTSLRQGSVIHIYDEHFEEKSRRQFETAYMTHTTTSPNYQILSSLDMGRRQVELEGYKLINETIKRAFHLRDQLKQISQVLTFFKLADTAQLMPKDTVDKFSTNHLPNYMESIFLSDYEKQREFLINPTHITLDISATGLTGSEFRSLLMDKYFIQVNKTSQNSVLFVVNIGTTDEAVTKLIHSLIHISETLKASKNEQAILPFKKMPPCFSGFHPIFTENSDPNGRVGKIRKAYYAAKRSENIEYLPINRQLIDAIGNGAVVVSAEFVTPYPPGFPVLIPGQKVTLEIAEYLVNLDVKEIHGYDPSQGLRVFRLKKIPRRRMQFMSKFNSLFHKEAQHEEAKELI